jgi:hypothetical protein
MSDPAQPVTPPPTTARRARWLDRVTALLLCIGAGGALAGAEPSIARALAEEPPADDAPSRPRTHSPSPSIAPLSRTSASDENPHFAPDDDDPHVTELERMYPDGMWPGQHRDPSPVLTPPSSTLRPGRASAALTLRESASPTASVIGHVPAGTGLTVRAELGEWVLVVLRQPDGATLFGWTTRAGVTILP